MNPPQSYEVIVLGGGKGGKTLATELGNKGVKTALIERSAEMIGGACINVACIPTKTLIASRASGAADRQLWHSHRRGRCGLACRSPPR
jgi:pyruvate/2-oxoglutarate dehydrogenase complex dihydrolipoamide dehydrogenase (E3) component